ncbi:MAG: radical SAM protein [Eggerthellaceae bacterium]
MHEWEEPCISQGNGSGTVFFSGCPLRCCYCQNYDISLGNRGRAIPVSRLVAIFFELAEQGAANINLVTGTQYVPWIVPAVAQARQRGLSLPVVWNTSGYERDGIVRSLAGTVDVYLSDFKYAPGTFSDAARVYSGAPDYFEVAVSALDAMVETTGMPRFDGSGRLLSGVVVRHLLLPGRLEDSEYVMHFLWERYGNRVLYSLMSQYTPIRTFDSMPELNKPTDKEAYEALLNYADELGLDDYYWQEGDAAKESFIPPFDETGVQGPGDGVTDVRN